MLENMDVETETQSVYSYDNSCNIENQIPIIKEEVILSTDDFEEKLTNDLNTSFKVSNSVEKNLKLKNAIVLLKRCNVPHNKLQWSKNVQDETHNFHENFDSKNVQSENVTSEPYILYKPSINKNNKALPDFKLSVQKTKQLFGCDICGKLYLCRSSLRQHSWNLHQISLPFLKTKKPIKSQENNFNKNNTSSKELINNVRQKRNTSVIPKLIEQEEKKNNFFKRMTRSITNEEKCNFSNDKKNIVDDIFDHNIIDKTNSVKYETECHQSSQSKLQMNGSEKEKDKKSDSPVDSSQSTNKDKHISITITTIMEENGHKVDPKENQRKSNQDEIQKNCNYKKCFLCSRSVTSLKNHLRKYHRVPLAKIDDSILEKDNLKLGLNKLGLDLNVPNGTNQQDNKLSVLNNDKKKTLKSKFQLVNSKSQAAKKRNKKTVTPLNNKKCTRSSAKNTEFTESVSIKPFKNINNSQSLVEKIGNADEIHIEHSQNVTNVKESSKTHSDKYESNLDSFSGETQNVCHCGKLCRDPYRLFLHKSRCCHQVKNTENYNVKSNTICHCGKKFQNQYELSLHENQCKSQLKEIKNYDIKLNSNTSNLQIRIKKCNNSYQIINRDNASDDLQDCGFTEKLSNNNNNLNPGVQSLPESSKYSTDHKFIKLKPLVKDICVEIED